MSDEKTMVIGWWADPPHAPQPVRQRPDRRIGRPNPNLDDYFGVA